MYYKGRAKELKELLQLEREPIGITRSDVNIANFPHLDEEVQSGCKFWIIAEKQMFYASAQEHFNCPLGAHVMGFKLPEEKQKELNGLVEEMCSKCYIRPEEVEQIPKFKESSKGAIYGPLKEHEFIPEIILLWITPKINMLLQESFQQTSWDKIFQYPTFGRPGCGILPMVDKSPNVNTSFGCTGMRFNTEIEEHLMLVTFPGYLINKVIQKLKNIKGINDHMEKHYQEVKEKIHVKSSK